MSLWPDKGGNDYTTKNYRIQESMYRSGTWGHRGILGHRFGWEFVHVRALSISSWYYMNAFGIPASRREWPTITEIEMSLWAWKMVEKGYIREKCNFRKSHQMIVFFLSAQRRHSSQWNEECTGTVALVSHGLCLVSELGLTGRRCWARYPLVPIGTHGDDKIFTQSMHCNSTYIAGARWVQFYNVWLS